MNHDAETDAAEDVVRIATQVMGWEICPPHQFSTGPVAVTENDGRKRLSGDSRLASDYVWNPFVDANADVQVLERVRETWARGRSLEAAERWLAFEARAGVAVDYQVGDFSRFALAVLNQETR